MRIIIRIISLKLSLAGFKQVGNLSFMNEVENWNEKIHIIWCGVETGCKKYLWEV